MTSELLQCIDRVRRDFAHDENPYLLALRDGSVEGQDFSREDFVATQVQFYYAVVFFSRPMAVLAAKIPSAAMRTEILRNVWEEHGEADPARRHGVTFLSFLDRLAGLRKSDVEAYALWPELRAFNTTLIGCATLDDWEIGCAMLGMIERQFAEISAWIGQAVVARGWIAEQDLVHYSLHATLDIRHSDDFFEQLAPSFEESPLAQYRVEQGLRLGAYVFDRLYRDLFASRKRREKSPAGRPQAHIYAE